MGKTPDLAYIERMQTVGELSSASRDLALHRFRLLEPTWSMTDP
jgi:hypothetical protein